MDPNDEVCRCPASTPIETSVRLNTEILPISSVIYPLNSLELNTGKVEMDMFIRLYL